MRARPLEGLPRPQCLLAASLALGLEPLLKKLPLRVEKLYIACRWNYQQTSRAFLQDSVAHVSANGRTVSNVRPMDWGPNERTGRVADFSPGLAEALGLSTNDTCEVTIYASGK